MELFLTNQQNHLSIDQDLLMAAVRLVLHEEGIRSGDVSLAIVDDAAIHDLNCKYLEHDYPTDVLSFLLEEGEGHLEGELIVSAEMAASRAAEFGWAATQELILYVVHGTLHLVGFDDQTPEQRAIMTEKENHYMALLKARSGGSL